MPEQPVDQNQCEKRRYHCGEAMAKAMDRMEARQTKFHDGLRADLTPLVTTVAENATRSKSNRTWLFWLIRGVFGAALVAVIVAAVMHFTGAG